MYANIYNLKFKNIFIIATQSLIMAHVIFHNFSKLTIHFFFKGKQYIKWYHQYPRKSSTRKKHWFCNILPTGWQNIEYPTLVTCHIAFGGWNCNLVSYGGKVFGSIARGHRQLLVRTFTLKLVEVSEVIKRMGYHI